MSPQNCATLQNLTLDFRFYLNTHLHVLYDSEGLWSPLVSLISESSSPCIQLRVKASEINSRDMTTELLSSFSRCPNLTQMVEQGVLVITPAMPKPLLESVSDGKEKTFCK